MAADHEIFGIPNYNLFRYSGVLAPNSKLRKHVVSNPKAGELQAASEAGSDSTLPATKYSSGHANR